MASLTPGLRESACMLLEGGVPDGKVCSCVFAYVCACKYFTHAHLSNQVRPNLQPAKDFRFMPEAQWQVLLEQFHGKCPGT